MSIQQAQIQMQIQTDTPTTSKICPHPVCQLQHSVINLLAPVRQVTYLDLYELHSLSPSLQDSCVHTILLKRILCLTRLPDSSTNYSENEASSVLTWPKVKAKVGLVHRYLWHWEWMRIPFQIRRLALPMRRRWRRRWSTIILQFLRVPQQRQGSADGTMPTPP